MNSLLKTIKDLQNSRAALAISNFSDKVILPGFSGMNLKEMVKFLMECIKKGDFQLRGAAIAYNFFMALFPSLLVLVSLIPYIPIENLQVRLVELIAGMLPPQLSELIDGIIKDLILKKHGVALSIGFLMALYYSSSGINSLLKAFNKSYQLTLTRNPIRQRVASIVLFLIITILMIIGTSLIIFGNELVVVILPEHLEQNRMLVLAIKSLEWISVVMFIMLSISILYHFGNTERGKWKLFSPGASLASVTIILVSYGLSVFTNNFGNYNQLYGSIGSIIGIMLWIYVVSTILLMGFELHTKADFRRRKR